MIPKTRPILAILEPTTLLIAIAGALFKAACKLTKSSGADVAKETTVMPITILEIFNLNDNAMDALTRKSPPTTKSIRPKITQSMLMK